METLFSLQDVGNGKVHSTTLVEREKKTFIQFKLTVLLIFQCINSITMMFPGESGEIFIDRNANISNIILRVYKKFSFLVLGMRLVGFADIES